MARSPFTYRVDRLRGYLRILRMLLSSDEVRASRVELAGHLTQLETLAPVQLEELETLAAAAEAGNAAGPGEERRGVGSPDEG